MIDSEISIIFITSRSSKRELKRLRLSFLIFREREKLKRLILTKFEQALNDEQNRRLNYQETFLRTNNFIKHLHSHVRFFIDDVENKTSLNIDSLFLKSQRLISNITIIRQFCDIFKNNTENKK